MNRFDQLPKVLQNKISEYNADHRPKWNDVMQNIILYKHKKKYEDVMEELIMDDMSYFNSFVGMYEDHFLNELLPREDREETIGLLQYYRFLEFTDWVPERYQVSKNFKMKNKDKILYNLSKDLKRLLNDIYLDNWLGIPWKINEMEKRLGLTK